LIPSGQPHLAGGKAGCAQRGVDGILDRRVDAGYPQSADQASGTRSDRPTRLDQTHPGGDTSHVAGKRADGV
jgi:hypothetical protein